MRAAEDTARRPTELLETRQCRGSCVRAALARAAFQKYGVDDVGAVAKSIIEWVMLKGGTDNMTCVIQVLDKDSLKKLDSRTVGSCVEISQCVGCCRRRRKTLISTQVGSECEACAI